MTERERLIELLKQKSCAFVPCDNECLGCHNVEMYDSQIESIADHLLANGVIVPPCKVGDTVWHVADYLGEKIQTYWVCAIENDKFNSSVVVSRVEGDSVLHRVRAFHFSDFGKTVFLSREDAEKALAERSKNGNV